MSKFLSLSVLLASITTLAISTPVKAEVVTRCQIQPRANQPSPLGMRTTLDVEEKGGDVTFTYKNLPTPVSADQPPVTIEQSRTMIFYKTTLAAARERMLKDPKYFAELRGSSDAEGFKPINDLLVCQNQASQNRSAIADLADGSYRVWNGAPSFTVTDQQLLEKGAYTFLFTKTGNRIVGFFARPNDDSMCITGTVQGNTITGVVNPPARFANPASRQNRAFDSAGFLRLGAWSDRGNLGAFSPSTLNLTNFNRINIGQRKAPTLCR
ncbi:hypothetical protein IQ250_21720 [Pseudanabaenaceae cyanobacterium LEGE 13415]|nr:hypothetical protein [Pseudanabaenaceae cyanobacterium LEGE 13415]